MTSRVGDRTRAVVAPLALALVLVGLWQLVVSTAGWPDFVLPGPRSVAARLVQDLADRSTWTHLGVTLTEALGGCLLGAVAAVMLRGMPNDVFFKVGMITIIGLSAKNAILIVEFARQLHGEGRSLLDAAVTAARLRLRPILMTSLAFTLGVVPLMLASGASAETQHAIGTGVFGGMISGTLLAIFFVPVFFVFVIGTQARIQAWRAQRAQHRSC